ncbi:MAG: hypothetical protein ACYSU1_01955 [Planctomycetota bacterium]
MQDRSPLDGLLEVCDRLREIQDQMARGARPGEQTLADLQEDVAGLEKKVFRLLPGITGEPSTADLDANALLVLGLLFHRRVSGDAEALSGAGLCGLLMRGGMPRTTALELLSAGSLLRLGGWVLCEASTHGFDPLDSFFLPSSGAMNLFWPNAKTEEAPEEVEARDTPQPFVEESEYLWEIGAWRQVCLQRAEALFEVDPITGLSSDRLQALREHAHARWVEIRRRLAVTPGGREFGLERLAASHKLGPDHILMVAHLLFAETLDVELYLAPGECLRVVADHRDDLLRKRRMVSAQGRLRREGLILADGEESAKMLAVPLCLADWVVERVLQGVGRSLKWNQQELEEFLRGDNER